MDKKRISLGENAKGNVCTFLKKVDSVCYYLLLMLTHCLRRVDFPGPIPVRS